MLENFAVLYLFFSIACVGLVLAGFALRCIIYALAVFLSLVILMGLVVT